MILKNLESAGPKDTGDELDSQKISNTKIAGIEQTIKRNAHKIRPLKVCSIDSKF